MNNPADLRPLQLFFLAGAVFVVSAGYGALLPLLPAWLSLQIPGSTPGEVARHVGFLSGAYTAGVLVGAVVGAVVDGETVGGVATVVPAEQAAVSSKATPARRMHRR